MMYDVYPIMVINIFLQFFLTKCIWLIMKSTCTKIWVQNDLMIMKSTYDRKWCRMSKDKKLHLLLEPTKQDFDLVTV
jgi:hypothetical protein